jgi:hypothetical protein
MSVETYHGSCHCGRVRYQARIDFARGTTKCNCTFCWKTRNWGVIVRPDAFTLLSGEEELVDYQGETNRQGHQLFCRHCGVRSFARGFLEVLGGAYYTVQVSCLDDLPTDALLAAPTRLCDGRNNNWMNPPGVSGHL